MTDRESIRRTLVAYLEDDLGEPVASFDDGVDIKEGLGLDSVDVVGLVMQVEREFRVRLTAEELGGVVRVGDLLDLLQFKLAASASAPASEAEANAA